MTYKKKSSWSAQRVDFPFVLMTQLNNIGEVIKTGAIGQVNNSISVLDAFLEPYKQEKEVKALEKIDIDLDEALKKEGLVGANRFENRDKATRKDEKEFAFALLRLKTLMQVMSKGRFLVVEDSGVEATDEITE